MEENLFIETMNAAQAAAVLRGMGMNTSPEKIRNGIQQGVYPFGDAVVMEKQTICTIYRKQLMDWARERATTAGPLQEEVNA